MRKFRLMLIDGGARDIEGTSIADALSSSRIDPSSVEYFHEEIDFS